MASIISISYFGAKQCHEETSTMEITDATFLVRRVGTFVKNAKAVVIEHAGDKYVFPLCIKYDHSQKQVRDAKQKLHMNKRQDGILNVCRKLFPNRTNVKEELYPLDDYVRFLGVLESKDVDSRPNRAENILAANKKELLGDIKSLKQDVLEKRRNVAKMNIPALVTLVEQAETQLEATLIELLQVDQTQLAELNDSMVTDLGKEYWVKVVTAYTECPSTSSSSSTISPKRVTNDTRLAKRREDAKAVIISYRVQLDAAISMLDRVPISDRNNAAIESLSKPGSIFLEYGISKFGDEYEIDFEDMKARIGASGTDGDVKVMNAVSNNIRTIARHAANLHDACLVGLTSQPKGDRNQNGQKLSALHGILQLCDFHGSLNRLGVDAREVVKENNALKKRKIDSTRGLNLVFSQVCGNLIVEWNQFKLKLIEYDKKNGVKNEKREHDLRLESHGVTLTAGNKSKKSTANWEVDIKRHKLLDGFKYLWLFWYNDSKSSNVEEFYKTIYTDYGCIASLTILAWIGQTKSRLAALNIQQKQVKTDQSNGNSSSSSSSRVIYEKDRRTFGITNELIQDIIIDQHSYQFHSVKSPTDLAVCVADAWHCLIGPLLSVIGPRLHMIGRIALCTIAEWVALEHSDYQTRYGIFIGKYCSLFFIHFFQKLTLFYSKKTLLSLFGCSVRR